jgi:1-acyl-sn-glycerol-3-phosphate acyltransferase
MDSPEPAAEIEHHCCRWWFQRLKDLTITLLLWAYFTLGFVAFFAPFYLLAFVFAKDRQAAFQHLNCWFYKVFFKLCRLLIPRHAWAIDPKVPAIRSAIIVCNHLSYLDSILLVSLFPRHTTIAKSRLFAIPILGSLLKHSGYMPSSGRGRYADLLLKSLEATGANLEQGGNIIVFPEGTRSRDGQIGELQKGFLKIAKYCQAPIKVVRVSNTDRLFAPGKFLFNTGIENVISLKLVAEHLQGYRPGGFIAKDLIAEIHALLGGDTHQPYVNR